MADTPNKETTPAEPKPKKERPPRQAMPEQEPEDRARNFYEVPYGYTPELAMLEAGRCLTCKKPKCVDGCPVHVDIPGFIALIQEGKFIEAAHHLKEQNALPAICGRVCPQEEQCEQKCILGLKGEPVAVGRLERFVADYERQSGAVATPELPPKTGKKVAIIGAGLVLTPIAALAGGSGAAAAVRLAGAGAALIAAALAVSLAHLGRPLRAARAAANLRQSRLSAEVLFALATLAAALISFAWPALLPGASMVAGLLAGELLVSLGLVYALPNQPAWRGPAAASPMTMALPLAVLALAARGGEPFGAWRPVVAVLLAADLGLFAWRALRLFSIPSWCEPAYSRRFRHRAVLLALRFTLVTLMPLFFALVARPLAATVALAFGILADFRTELFPGSRRLIELA
ncbi:MAG TPA: hypothetical protein PLC40_04235, partial [Candidatus Hydrogenedentes bacterium]|nr:hypothetical protein [Candidatus Hydrogenedentota bacterium]